jgi:hypothetical protein
MHSSKHLEVAAESSVKTQVKTNASPLVVTTPSPPPVRGAAPRSQTSRESKRRKPHTTKPTPGQNVASATCSLFTEIKLNDYRKITKKRSSNWHIIWRVKCSGIRNHGKSTCAIQHLSVKLQRISRQGGGCKGIQTLHPPCQSIRGAYCQ